MVPVRDSAGVSDYLWACGLAGCQRVSNHSDIKTDLLRNRHCLCGGGDLYGAEHIHQQFVGGARTDPAEMQDALREGSE